MDRHIFKTVEERNNFIVECYNKGLSYYFYDKNKEGYYIVDIETNN